IDQLLVADDRPLDRLSAARLEHRPRDRVQAAPLEVAEAIDRELGTVHGALDHDRLAHVAGEEARLRGVLGAVDRARARTTAGLDHHGVVQRLAVRVREPRDWRWQSEALP